MKAGLNILRRPREGARVARLGRPSIKRTGKGESNMKRALSAMATIALLAATSTASAQTMEDGASNIDFGVGAGVTFPQGDLGDFTKTGWHIAGMLGWRPATMPVGFRFDLAYHGLSGKDIDLGTGGEAEGPNVRVIALTANAELDLSRLSGSAMKFRQSGSGEEGSASVYLTGGVGAYNGKIEDGDSETDLGINVGAGVNFFLAGMQAFVEGRFHNVFSDDTSVRMIPITFGVRFGGPGR
jgi:hypothetical protein